tara:strand:+ start:18649 stop:19773 length:1125 start_codon:yes stop_codon:yes gene_type:complete
MKKKIIFITGTRADYGKIKSIIKILEKSGFDIKIFITGMHLMKKFGETYNEIMINFSTKKIFKFKNYKPNNTLDLILSNTIIGFSKFLKKEKPDLVMTHGDRVETLAAAISASFNNILVGHIEGGEISGSIDEHIRHSVSKLSHLHFVSTNRAKRRLINMGEEKKSIFKVGSPDIDIMSSSNLPKIDHVKERYDIKFNQYGILIYHPVTSEIKDISKNTNEVVLGAVNSNKKFIVIFPNNDPGNEKILNIYKKKIFHNKNFKIIRSMRFEYFISLLKNSSLIIGNSSTGVIEAPFYGITTINVGDRQNMRGFGQSIINVPHKKEKIKKQINLNFGKRFRASKDYGNGSSNKLICKILKKTSTWKTSLQKTLNDK